MSLTRFKVITLVAVTTATLCKLTPILLTLTDVGVAKCLYFMFITVTNDIRNVFKTLRFETVLLKTTKLQLKSFVKCVDLQHLWSSRFLKSESFVEP